MTFRHFIVAAALAAAIVACNDKGRDVPSPAADTSRATPAPGGASTGAVVDSDGVALDSVPLRTPDGKPARFAWRSGHLVFRYTGGVLGTREIWFDQWGIREWRSDSSAPVKERPGPPQHAVVIADADKFTFLDYTTMTGWTMPNQTDDEYLRSDSGKMFSLGEMVFKTSGGKRLPDEVVNGVSTKVLQLDQGFASTRIWVWQGIVVKEQFHSQDGTEYVIEPVKLDFDVDVPESRFTVPAGFKIVQRQEQTGPVGPPGGAPPGAMPPGAMPPGAMPPGAMPPGAMPPGAVPPGGPMTQPGPTPPPPAR
jgi:hypothetical protein